MIGIELEAGIEKLREKARAITDVQEVSLLESLGRVLAEDIYAPIDNPPFDRSPLDGYAFLASSSKGATTKSPVALEIVGEACAGHYYEGEIKEGQAIRIMTGAYIPEGCDCVIRQEDTFTEGSMVWVQKELKHHQNYCFRGEDIKKGICLVKKGECIQYSHVGVLASMGLAKVPVLRKLRVGVLSTGDEIVDAGQPLSPGKIYNSNLYTITARLLELGIEPVVIGLAGDEAQQVAKVIEENIDRVDLMITTGGVSVGIKDIIHEVVPLLGAERLFWKLKIKPGTPVICAEYKEKLLICLSGNPFAALATFELIARPVMAKLSGNANVNYQVKEAILMDDFKKASEVRRFIRGKYDEGKMYLTTTNHSSGVLFSALGCNGMIDIPKGTDKLEAGQKVKVVVL